MFNSRKTAWTEIAGLYISKSKGRRSRSEITDATLILPVIVLKLTTN